MIMGSFGSLLYGRNTMTHGPGRGGREAGWAEEAGAGGLRKGRIVAVYWMLELWCVSEGRDRGGLETTEAPGGVRARADNPARSESHDAAAA